MEWWVFVGAVGITLIISKGLVFKGARTYLVGFSRAYNPLRWLGLAMKCSMCAGFWVGLGFGWWAGFSLLEWFAIGGCISLSAFVVGCLAGWLERFSGNCYDEDEDVEEEPYDPRSVLDGITQMRTVLDRKQRMIELEMEKEKEEEDGGDPWKVQDQAP